MYYLSAEFLMGRTLTNAVHNMDLQGEYAEVRGWAARVSRTKWPCQGGTPGRHARRCRRCQGDTVGPVQGTPDGLGHLPAGASPPHVQRRLLTRATLPAEPCRPSRSWAPPWRRCGARSWTRRWATAAWAAWPPASWTPSPPWTCPAGEAEQNGTAQSATACAAVTRQHWLARDTCARCHCLRCCDRGPFEWIRLTIEPLSLLPCAGATASATGMACSSRR